MKYGITNKIRKEVLKDFTEYVENNINTFYLPSNRLYLPIKLYLKSFKNEKKRS